MIDSSEHAFFTTVEKGTKVMIGEGEHSCFIDAGLTPEESRLRLDNKLDEICGESGIKRGFAKIKSKVDDFLGRNFSNK